MRSLRGPDRAPPPLMDPTRKRDGQRILALFRPYRMRLAAVLVLIVISAGVGMLQPFLLRDALDVGLREGNNAVLTATVLGMLGVAIFTAATGVWQTYMSNQVGQRVMHDLRTAVYRHLQKMSLAMRDCTSPVRVRVKKASDIRWRWR